MAKRTLRVEMDEIIEAMGSSEAEPLRYFLDLETGRVEMLVDDLFDRSEDDEVAQLIDDNPDRFEQIPRMPTRDQYDLMCRFAESVDEEDIRQLLGVALQGKGAFSRFRDVVHRYPDLKARWFADRERALLAEATRWLDAIDIAPMYELRRVEESPTPAPAKHEEPRIGLLEVILLGAPDGKTEVLGGRTFRQVRARSLKAAQKIFANVARDLCAFHGVEWRKRFIENKSAFDLEGAHLRIDGDLVILEIEVTREIWEEFTRV